MQKNNLNNTIPNFYFTSHFLSPRPTLTEPKNERKTYLSGGIFVLLNTENVKMLNVLIKSMQIEIVLETLQLTIPFFSKVTHTQNQD